MPPPLLLLVPATLLWGPGEEGDGPDEDGDGDAEGEADGDAEGDGDGDTDGDGDGPGVGVVGVVVGVGVAVPAAQLTPSFANLNKWAPSLAFWPSGTSPAKRSTWVKQLGILIVSSMLP